VDKFFRQEKIFGHFCHSLKFRGSCAPLSPPATTPLSGCVEKQASTMHKPWRRQTAVVQDDQPPKRRTQSSSAELQPSGPQRRQRLLVKDRYRIVVMGALSKHEPTKPKTSKLFHYTTLTLTLPLLLTLLLTPIPTLTLYQSQPYSLTLISNSIPNPILNLIFLNLRLYHCFSVLSVQVLTIHGRDGCGGRGQDLYHLAPAV